MNNKKKQMMKNTRTQSFLVIQSKLRTFLKRSYYAFISILKFLFKAFLIALLLYFVLSSNPQNSHAQDWNETIMTELMNFYVYFVIYCPIE